MSNSIILSVGQYVAEISPAAQIKGSISEFGNGPYEISLEYYNKTVSFTTRPTIANGSIGEQPEFT